MIENKWMNPIKRDYEGAYNLFCFHHAGGNSSIFRRWGDYLEKRMSVYPVVLPHHENRIREKMPESVQKLAKQFVEDNIADLGEKPFVLYGHSMGAIIAYEIAVVLQQEFHTNPLGIVVSGEGAPYFTKFKNETENMDQDEFVLLLKDYAGMDPELLKNKQFMDYYLPVVLEDFKFYENYEMKEAVVLHCPIIVINGDEDSHIVTEEINDWSKYTDKETQFYTMHGNHFFILHSGLEITNVIKRIFIQ